MAATNTSRIQRGKKPRQGNSGSTIPPAPPTGMKSQKTELFPPSSQRAHAQGWSNSLSSSQQSSLAPTPLPSGRHRSVSFDEAYFPQLLPPGRSDQMADVLSDGAVARQSPSATSSRFSRHVPSRQGSSPKEWESLSDGDNIHSRKRSSTLNTHVVPHQRDVLGETRIRHPILSIYKRNHHSVGWRGSQESCSSSEFSHLSRNRRGGKHHYTIEERALKYENTYRLMPTINFHSVESTIRRIMVKYLEDTIRRLTNDDAVVMARDAANAAKGLSEAIKHQVKLKQLQRYKIISLATICQRSGQDFVSSSQCVWETSTDGFQTVTRQSKDWFGEVTVYAVYQE